MKPNPKYPLLSKILAGVAVQSDVPPLPNLTEPEFWDRNFERTQDRPGKRLGVELKAYLEMHRKAHPKGSYVTSDDLAGMLNMTDREVSRVPLAVQYLLARKVLEKTRMPDRYRIV